MTSWELGFVADNEWSWVLKTVKNKKTETSKYKLLRLRLRLRQVGFLKSSKNNSGKLKKLNAKESLI